MSKLVKLISVFVLIALSQVAFAERSVIHLLWVTKPSQLKVGTRLTPLPSADRFPIQRNTINWARLNPDAEVNLWVNFNDCEDKAAYASLQRDWVADGVIVRDIHSLDTHFKFDYGLGDGPEVVDLFGADSYFSLGDWVVIDLLKLLMLKSSVAALPSYFFDIDIEPQPLEELYKTRIQNHRAADLLQQYGFLVGHNVQLNQTIIHENRVLIFYPAAKERLDRWIAQAVEFAFRDEGNAWRCMQESLLFKDEAGVTYENSNTTLPMIDVGSNPKRVADRMPDRLKDAAL